MKRARHPLHQAVGQFVRNRFPECEIVEDPACCGDSGKQWIPLFCSGYKSSETRYCNVDLLLLKNHKPRVIIEIEETDITPTHICGKFLTAALSRYYIHKSRNNTPIEMNNPLLFVQILTASGLAEKSHKKKQGHNLEESIGNVLPIKGSKINTYKLLYVNVKEAKLQDENSSESRKLARWIKNALR